MRRRPLAFAAGALLGLLVTPLLVLVFARAATTLYDSLQDAGTYSMAVTGARDLAAALDRYRGQHHRMPTAQEGLRVLAPEFVPYVPDDPWGHPYVYAPTGPDWADVLSHGADGRAGGYGADADISARFGRLGDRPPALLRPLMTVLLVSLPIAAALTATHVWCAGALAGLALFWGAMLLAMVGSAWNPYVTPLSFAAGVGCFTGALAVALDLPQARIVALVAVTIAYGIIQHLLMS